MKEVLSLFHHIHHNESKHEVHHCGGKHIKINPKLDYIIKHCSCGNHSISKEYAIGHATDKKLKPIEVKLNLLKNALTAVGILKTAGECQKP